MDLKQLSEQYQGATLAKLIESQIRAMSEDQLLAAIKGTYDNFPEQFRPVVDSYTLEYPQLHWLGPQIKIADLGGLFGDSIESARALALEHHVALTDDQAFDLFNLSVMRLSYFAHSRPDFRKEIGIKKGWFR